MATERQTRPRLTKVVNIITRTSHYASVTMRASDSDSVWIGIFALKWQTRPRLGAPALGGLAFFRAAGPAGVRPCAAVSYVFPTTTGTRLWHMPINLGTIRTSRYAPLSIQNDSYSPI
jgi:hypothetical protein